MKKLMQLKNYLVYSIIGIILCANYAHAVQDAAAYTVGKRYNIARQLTGVIQPDPDGPGPLRYAATRTSYNTQGLPAVVENGELASWQDETIKPSNWSGFTVLTRSEKKFDDWGRPLSIAVSDKNNTMHTLTQYAYDEEGRVKCRAVRMNMGYFRLHFHINRDACWAGTWGPAGEDRVTTFVYDKLDRVLEEHRAVGTTLAQRYKKYSYDDNHNIENVWDANGNRTNYTYDKYGRLHYTYFPRKTVTGSISNIDFEYYIYDENDNRTTYRKRDGRRFTYVFDDLNNMTHKDVPDTSVKDVYYAYDLRGLQTHARFSSHTGPGVTTEYDGFGRITSESTNVSGTTYTTTHQYDKNGNRTRVTHQDGQFYSYHHDGLNRLVDIKENGSSLLIRQKYDRFSRPQTRTTSGNVVTRLAYDEISRVNGIHFQAKGGNYFGLDFSYNPANQMVTQNLSDSKYSYKGSGGNVGDYQINGLNQYVDVSGVNFQYDDNGNLTSNGETTYTYDTENRLLSARGAKKADLKYDPLGRLYEVSAPNGKSTYFLYDGDSLIGEFQNGVMIQRYVHGDGVDKPLVSYSGSAVGPANRQLLHANYQGPIITATDNDGNLNYVNTYDACGVPGSGNTGRFAYTGQMYLPELGLYHYKARVYDPRLGRFLQTDPVGYEDQMNLYAHVVGGGKTTRIGANGKPLKGNPELTSKQRTVVQDNKSKVRSSVNKIRK